MSSLKRDTISAVHRIYQAHVSSDDVGRNVYGVLGKVDVDSASRVIDVDAFTHEDRVVSGAQGQADSNSANGAQGYDRRSCPPQQSNLMFVSLWVSTETQTAGIRSG